MWIAWLLVVLVSVSLVIVQAVMLARDENRAVTAPPGEWSPAQRRLLKVIRVSGAIGLLIVWSALVYVLIDTGGSHLMQPWLNRPQAWGVAYSLMYTAFFLNLMRTWHSPIARSARRPSYVLALQAFVISGGFNCHFSHSRRPLLPTANGLKGGRAQQQGRATPARVQKRQAMLAA